MNKAQALLTFLDEMDDQDDETTLARIKEAGGPDLETFEDHQLEMIVDYCHQLDTQDEGVTSTVISTAKKAYDMAKPHLQTAKDAVVQHATQAASAATAHPAVAAGIGAAALGLGAAAALRRRAKAKRPAAGAQA